MNSKEFLEEMKHYLMVEKAGQVDRLHTELLGMMDSFHTVCVASGIDYYLGFGSLLGAVRDHGIIPWDRDIDLLIKYEDKDRLIDALNQSSDSGIRYICKENDKKYEHFDMRIYKSTHSHHMPHIDIFYLIDAPDDRAEYVKYAKKLINLANCRFHKLDYRSSRTKLAALYHKTIRALHFAIPIGFLDARFKSLSEKYSEKNTHTYFRTCLSKKRNLKVMYKKQWFASTVTCEMNGHEYFAPVGYQEFLSAFFGDYMKYPKFESCVDEYLDTIKAIEMFEAI